MGWGFTGLQVTAGMHMMDDAGKTQDEDEKVREGDSGVPSFRVK